MSRPPTYMDGFILSQSSNIPGVNGVPATLKEVSYACQILNNILKINMKQVFKSSSSTDFSESLYEVTVQEGACLEHFEASFEGKKVLGVVKSKKAAQEEYETAKSQGSLVSYAEIQQKTTSEKLFKVKLGNLPPNSDVEIAISFSYQVDSLLNSFYAVSIPLIFVENIEAVKLGKPVLTLELACTGAITYCESKGYPAEIEKIDSNTYKIALSYAYIQDKFPFQLVYGYEGMFEPQVVFGASKVKVDDAVKQAIMPTRESIFVSFLPAFNSDSNPQNQGSAEEENIIEIDASGHEVVSGLIKDSIVKCPDVWSDEYQAKVKDELIDHMEASKSEFIFLLDRSGSMSGSPITKAVQALTLFLQSLPTDSYFNVVSFGSSFSNLFSKSRKYNKESLQQAISTISSYSANFGGTEIFEPLENVLSKQEKIKHYNKQVFLLTDGEVSRPEEVIQLVKQHCKYARVHAIGFGSGADKHLIEGSAKAGRGQSKIIDLSDDLSELIVTMLSACLTPTLDDFQIEYDTSVIESVFPDTKSLPCILKDEIFNLHLFLQPLVKVEDLTEGQRSIKVSYFDSKKKARVNSLVPLQTTDAFICNESIRESAFKLGKQLQLNEKIEGIQIKKQNHNAGEKEKQENEIVQESVDYQILNKLTALICVIHKLDDAQMSQFNASKSDVVYSAQFGFIPPAPQISLPIMNQSPLKFQIPLCWNTYDSNFPSIIMNIPQQQQQQQHQQNQSCSILSITATSIPLINQRTEILSNQFSDYGFRFKYSVNPFFQSGDDDEDFKVCFDHKSRAIYNNKIRQKKEDDRMNEEQKIKVVQVCPTSLSSLPQRSYRLTLQQLLSQVDSDGVWRYNEKICLAYLSSDQLQTLKVMFAEDIDGFMSAMILGVLNKFFISEKAKWTLIGKKALSWIKSHSKIPDLQQVQLDILNALEMNEQLMS